jgi:hypothetical protein
MRSYYTSVNGQQTGPYTEAELKARNITPNTLLWAEGMPEWQSAEKVLPYLFTSQSQTPPPPPYPHQIHNAYEQPHVPEPKTWLVEAVLVTLFCCLPFGIIGIIKASNVSSLYTQRRYAEAQEASAQAGKWVKWGFAVGLIYVVLVFLYLVVLGGMAAMM